MLCAIPAPTAEIWDLKETMVYAEVGKGSHVEETRRPRTMDRVCLVGKEDLRCTV